MLCDVSSNGCIYRRMATPWKVINMAFLKGKGKWFQKEMYQNFQRGGVGWGGSGRWVQSSISNNLDRCKWEKCYHKFDFINSRL